MGNCLFLGPTNMIVPTGTVYSPGSGGGNLGVVWISKGVLLQDQFRMYFHTKDDARQE